MKKDQLNWEKFYVESQSRVSLPKKIEAFNRLVVNMNELMLNGSNS